MPLRIKVSATKRFKPEQMFAVLQEASNAALFATQESIREVAPVDKGLLASPAHWKTRVEQAAGTLRTLLTTQLHYATGTDAPYSTRGTEARFLSREQRRSAYSLFGGLEPPRYIRAGLEQAKQRVDSILQATLTRLRVGGFS